VRRSAKPPPHACPMLGLCAAGGLRRGSSARRRGGADNRPRVPGLGGGAATEPSHGRQAPERRQREAAGNDRSGRLRDARRTSAVAVEVAQRAGQGERAGLFEAGRAVWEAFYGNAAAARQSASKALALGRGREVDYAAAFALALAGDLPQSRRLAEDLSRASTRRVRLYSPCICRRFAPCSR
jgi:hypothetical protein